MKEKRKAMKGEGREEIKAVKGGQLRENGENEGRGLEAAMPQGVDREKGKGSKGEEGRNEAETEGEGEK